MSAVDPKALTEASVLEYVRSRDVEVAGDARVRALSGGVSCAVFAVESSRGGLIVKQATRRLRVQEEWLADPARALNEARALEILGALTPRDVPRLIDVNTSDNVILIELAPSTWRNWRDRLMAGHVSYRFAEHLGHVLATWHTETRGLQSDALPGSAGYFHDLRIAPFFDAAVRASPQLRVLVEPISRRVTAANTCLVHGDFSPKNVLKGAGGGWVLDFEVAHIGDPTFDVAFMLAHLFLKSIHRPMFQQRYYRAADVFLAAYGERNTLDPEHLSALTGCLLVARVDGKSPAVYLSSTSARIARKFGMQLIRNRAMPFDGAFACLEAYA